MKARSLRDGAYSSWEALLASRFPLALAEMSRPCVPLGRPDTSPLARWGVEIHSGWRSIVERLLDRLEAAIAHQLPEHRSKYRIVQLKEKLGGLAVYLGDAPTMEMRAAIQDAEREAAATCEVCGGSGQHAARRGWYSTKCQLHENWSPWSQLD